MAWRIGIASILACAACATVVGGDVTRSGPPDNAAQDEAAEASTSADGGDGGGDATLREPHDDAQTALGCGCGLDAACCVATASASCVAPDAGQCESAGSFVLGCLRSLPIDGRDCCWNESGPLRRTTLGVSCATDRAACVDDVDCAPFGDTCQKITCTGTTFGVCAAVAPADLVCP